MTAESRSVVVRLSMEAAQYIATAQKAGAVGADAMSKVEKSAHRASAANEEIGRSAGRGALLAAAGLGVVLLASARFDKAMSAVQAATHETTRNMGQLRLAALQAGKETVFSATEAAGAIEELAKAGVATRDIINGGLDGALDLAAAGNLAVAEAAETAASAMTQFRLSGEQVPHIADLLAAGAGKAQGSVHDLGMALNQTGLVASQTGLSIEETTGALAAFASNGLIGSDAGTSFKTMLLALNPQSKKAADLMDEIGFSAYDAQGSFVGMEELSRRLQTSLAGMSEQQRNATLQTLFGRDAIRAANVVYTEGEQGIRKWISAVDDQGYAAETADTRLNNLLGDIEFLKGSLETALIGAGQGSQGGLRSLVQTVTALVDVFNQLPPVAQSSLTALLAISALTGGGLWLGSKVIGKVSDIRTSLNDLATTSPKTARGLRLVATAAAGLAALEVAAAAVATFENATDRALPGLEELTSRLIALSQAEAGASLGTEFSDLGSSVDALSASGIHGLSNDLFELGESGSLLGNSLKGATGALAVFGNTSLLSGSKDFRESADQVTALDDALANLVSSGGAEQAQAAFAGLADAQGLSADQQKELLKLLPGYAEALQGAANQAELGSDSTDRLTRSTLRLKDGTEVTAEQVKALNKAYSQARKDAAETASSFLDISQNADKAKVSLREWIHQMEEQAQALEDFTANAIRAGKRGLADGLIAELERLGPVGALRMKQLANATQSEIDRANAAWKRGQHAVEEYVDATTKAPKTLKTTITVENAQALQQVRDVSVALRGLNDKTITLTTIVRTLHQETRLERGHAGGGIIRGRGTATSDSILTPTSDGEYVVQSAAVNKYGLGFVESVNNMTLSPGLAAGGSTSGSKASSGPSSSPFEAALQQLFDIIDGHSKKIDKTLKDFTPKLSQGVDGVRAEVQDLRRAIHEAGGHWTKAMQAQADELIEAARAHDIGKALRRFDVGVSDGADGVRSEVREFRDAIREAGGEWSKGLAMQGHKLIATASAYDLAAQSLSESQANLDDLLQRQSDYADQVGTVFDTSPFGVAGLGGFDKTVGMNTGQSSNFRDTLSQLVGQGLDGPLFEQLAASGDLKTAIQLLATGSAGIALREQSFAAMLAAQDRLGGFAGGQVFGQSVQSQQSVVQSNTAALTTLQNQLEAQEMAFKGVAKAVEGIPAKVGDQAYRGTKEGAKDGIAGVAANAVRTKGIGR